tara:strand:- start:1705 stop:1956 length:252 start_codon:yes stop_codon:yes gene_type:complete
MEGTAWRWHGEVSGMPTWVVPVGQDRPDSLSLFIKTPEGVMEAGHGDYIIQGIEGEVYPCKAEVFHQTHQGFIDGTQKLKRYG